MQKIQFFSPSVRVYPTRRLAGYCVFIGTHDAPLIFDSVVCLEASLTHHCQAGNRTGAYGGRWRCRRPVGYRVGIPPYAFHRVKDDCTARREAGDRTATPAGRLVTGLLPSWMRRQEEGSFRDRAALLRKASSAILYVHPHQPKKTQEKIFSETATRSRPEK